jgi:hypothetical protein
MVKKHIFLLKKYQLKIFDPNRKTVREKTKKVKCFTKKNDKMLRSYLLMDYNQKKLPFGSFSNPEII